MEHYSTTGIDKNNSQLHCKACGQHIIDSMADDADVIIGGIRAVQIELEAVKTPDGVRIEGSCDGAYENLEEYFNCLFRPDECSLEIWCSCGHCNRFEGIDGKMENLAGLFAQ